MNYQNGISPMSFGMAYYTANTKNFIKSLRKLNVQELGKLNEEMKAAQETLKETRWADVVSDADQDGKFIHRVNYRYPVFNDEMGKICLSHGSATYNTLPAATDAALAREASSEAMNEVMKTTEKILNETRIK